MVCSCCGEDRDESMVTSLLCHEDIKVCRVCVGWLSGRVGALDVTPTLPVVDMDEAARFCEAAGLQVRRYDDGFAFVHLDDQSVFDLDLVAGMEPETNHAGCYIITADVDDWHARLVAAGLHVTAVENMPWGMHEFTMTDPSGNNIRVGRPTSDDEESR
jgi:predicted enzyme related to lactoylglutathione lyase